MIYHRILILAALFTATEYLVAQTSFDPGDGCLNVIDMNSAKGVGEYCDNSFSVNYLHEQFINEQFSIGAGIGYSYHEKYKFSAIPVYLSSHYFFLDKRFSPFVNLRVGGFALFNMKNVGTNEKYSLSKEKQGFSLFMSPSVGVKMHITPSLGIMASINDDVYHVNAFDTQKNDYTSKLIHGLGINVGFCFQIKGW